MKVKLAAYPHYAKTAQPWVGHTPAHWETSRGKNLFTLMSRSVRPNDEVVTCFRDGTVTLRKNRRTTGFTESVKEIGYQGVRKGDLVIHAMDAFAGAVGVSDSDGKSTPVYAVCQPRPGVTAEYYALLVRRMALSGWITALAKGIRERSTDFRFSQFGSQYLPVPPTEEQHAIVKYVGHIEREVGSAIRVKGQLISLLNEQKNAIRHTYLTRGLDPSTTLKKAGVPGIDLIPAHWEVMRAKQLCERIVDCKNRTPELVPGGGYTVVRTTNIRSGHFRAEGSFETNKVNYEIWTQRGAPRRGDVFFTREAPTGEACLVPDLPGLCMGQRMMYLRPKPSILESRYLVHSIYGPATRTYIELATNGSTVGHLRLGQVGGLPVIWCPVDEQRAIVDRIDQEWAPLNKAIARAEREISLLREYQTRLTSDVVTGKLDVRAAAAALPDVDPHDPDSVTAFDTDEDGISTNLDGDHATEESM